MRNIFTPELRTEGSPSYPLGSHQGDKNVMTERPESWSWAGTQLSSVTQTNWTTLVEGLEARQHCSLLGGTMVKFIFVFLLIIPLLCHAQPDAPRNRK